jgi:hypothetical protein
MAGSKLSWPSSASEYTGAFSGGFAQGEGKFVWSGGSYSGSWSAGKPGGAGKVTFTGGETFEAIWKNGLGTGKFCQSALPTALCGDWKFSLFDKSW